jgi:G:T/U-mismatch repair DNA glycosylase
MGAESRPLEEVEQRARQRAVSWRASGVAEGLGVPVRPPASSRLLLGYLEPYRVAVLRPPAATWLQRAFRRMRSGVWRLIQGVDAVDIAARVERLESYTRILAEELTKTLARLDVELAEARTRVGALEDRGMDTPPSPHRDSPSPAAP